MENGRAAVNLGSKQYVNYLEVFWFNGPFSLRNYTYTVEVSDDNVKFTRVADRSSNTVMDMTRDGVNAEARYIKLKVTGALEKSHIWVRELQAWDVSG